MACTQDLRRRICAGRTRTGYHMNWSEWQLSWQYINDSLGVSVSPSVWSNAATCIAFALDGHKLECRVGAIRSMWGGDWNWGLGDRGPCMSHTRHSYLISSKPPAGQSTLDRIRRRKLAPAGSMSIYPFQVLQASQLTVSGQLGRCVFTKVRCVQSRRPKKTMAIWRCADQIA